jgi:hypothetical protein
MDVEGLSSPLLYDGPHESPQRAVIRVYSNGRLVLLFSNGE